MIQNNFKSNFVYNTCYQVLAILIPFVTTPYISRILGPEKIGEYSYAYSIANYFVLFAMLGLNNYGNRTIASVYDDRSKLSKRFCEIYVVQIVTTFVSLCGYFLYLLMFGTSILAVIMILYILSAGFDINWLFYGLEEFKLITVRNVGIKITSTILIFVLIKSEADIWKYALLMVGSILLSQVVVWPAALQRISYVKVSVKNVRAHFKSIMILFVPTIAVSIYKVMDKVMLGAMNSTLQVGFYESTEKVMAIPLCIINSLGTVMLPRMANMLKTGTSKSYQITVETSAIFAAFITAPMIAGIMSITREFVPIFYGHGYEQCISLLCILLPSCLFVALANVIRTQILIPQKEDKTYIVSCMAGAVVNLVLNTITIPTLGALGAAIATLIAEIIVCTYQAIKVWHDINMKFILSQYIVAVVMSAIMGVIVVHLSSLPFSQLTILIFKIIVGIMIYGSMILIYYKRIKTRN